MMESHDLGAVPSCRCFVILSGPWVVSSERSGRLRNLTISDWHQKVAAVRAPHDQEYLQRRTNAKDRQIDRLVYELYGLTDDEIRIVEEATR
ncbi:MAG: hypothetical protein V2A79_01535 [Planctomycetota bacterium]